MIKFIKNIVHSFNNEPSGFSARKLSAFAAVCTAIYVSIMYTTSQNLPDVLWPWLGFALLCLGIITAEQLIRFREGKNERSVTKTTVEKETITKKDDEI